MTTAICMAFYLGILCSISPCPLATNIAAVSFVGRRIGKPKAVLSAGVMYVLGRFLTFSILGGLLSVFITATPEISHVLQKYMNMLLGPLLILVAMALLGFLKFPGIGVGDVSEKVRRYAEKVGLLGALLLGIVFALSFCPTSAALFFGTLLPLAVKSGLMFLLPGIFGIGSGLPVLLLAFTMSLGTGKLVVAYAKMTMLETWAKRATGIIFLVIGIYFCMSLTLRII